MNLMLVIDTSRRPFNIVLGQGRACLFDSLASSAMADRSDLSAMVEEALRQSGRTIDEIGAVAVNIGPGALGSVRSGVSFANALGYGLGVPVYPVTSFELMGYVAAEQHRCPVLCTARASNGYAYVGVYTQGHLSFLGFGLIEEVAAAAIDGIERAAIAGDHRSTLCEILASRDVMDSGIERSVAATFLELATCSDRASKSFPEVAIPITEESELLLEPPEIPSRSKESP